MSDTGYRIPSATVRTEITVVNSRFVTTVARADHVDDAKAILASVRAEMPDANHHVYAFRVGYGNSVIDGMSDDGEPSGTAGPPVLAVLRGADIGDVVVIVSRFFGGTKLGTGGLVRAYSDAARAGLALLQTEWKIERRVIGLELPYPLYEPIRRLIAAHEGSIEDEEFGADVTVTARFPLHRIAEFATAVRDASAGRVEPVELDGD